MEIKKSATSTGPCLQFKYDFSLWFCETDEEVALHISEILTQSGYKGFVEHQDQVAGHLVIKEVTNVIQQSKVTIIILSQSSLGSGWCRRVSEWNLQHSIEKGNKVLPVYFNIKTEQIPPVFRHINGLHYDSNFFTKRLLDSLKSRKKSTYKYVNQMKVCLEQGKETSLE
ncbi:hypothetical protein chiPu_0009620 [Chiloscyllium punctatum]|uniref:TIR domain-containing protein n=1 Tax=Chiloscyllium punctatum TaxID=137246 RepID=A0A401SL95_CHIPU|nr:hypothetical protein [Chiloscyllium punctatum]